MIKKQINNNDIVYRNSTGLHNPNGPAVRYKGTYDGFETYHLKGHIHNIVGPAESIKHMTKNTRGLRNYYRIKGNIIGIE